MLNIYICEDNEKQREIIINSVTNAINAEGLEMNLQIATDNPFKLLENLQRQKENGIFFLDIDLNQEINGLELAKQIRKFKPRCYIIFITSHSEMCYMTFTYKVEAMDFIFKEDYDEMQNRIIQCLLQAHKLDKQNKITDIPKTFALKMGSKVQYAVIDDILFFEVSPTPHKLILHTKTSEIEFAGNLKDLEKELAPCFYRCHRSFIVNRNNIESIDTDNNVIKFEGGIECPVSVRLRKGLSS